jgi:hypothetical protein
LLIAVAGAGRKRRLWREQEQDNFGNNISGGERSPV